MRGRLDATHAVYFDGVMQSSAGAWELSGKNLNILKFNAMTRGRLDATHAVYFAVLCKTRQGGLGTVWQKNWILT